MQGILNYRNICVKVGGGAFRWGTGQMWGGVGAREGWILWVLRVGLHGGKERFCHGQPQPQPQPQPRSTPT